MCVRKKQGRDGGSCTHPWKKELQRYNAVAVLHSVHGKLELHVRCLNGHVQIWPDEFAGGKSYQLLANLLDGIQKTHKQEMARHGNV